MTVNPAVHVEVPPDNLAFIQFHGTGCKVCKTGVQGAGHVGKHPLAGCAGLGIQVVHVGGLADEQGLGLVDGRHVHRIDALGGVVGYGILYGLGEVLRYAGKRGNGGVLADDDGGYQGIDAFRFGNEGRYGLGFLVDGAGVDVVQHKVQDAGLVMKDAQRPVDGGVSVAHVDAFCGVHVQFLALNNIAGGAVGQGQFRDFHRGSGIDFRKTDHDAAGGQVDGSLEIVQGDGLDETVTTQFEVACCFLGAACHAKQCGCDIE